MSNSRRRSIVCQAEEEVRDLLQKAIETKDYDFVTKARETARGAQCLLDDCKPDGDHINVSEESSLYWRIKQLEKDANEIGSRRGWPDCGGGYSFRRQMGLL